MRSFLFLMFFLLRSGLMMGQCPVASFTLPDSGCAGEVFSITNSSTGGTGVLSSNWDFAAGDLRNPITGNNAGTFTGTVNSSLGVDLVFDGSNYFGFVANTYGALVRLDFGNDFHNAPVVNNLGNVNGLMGGMYDIHILQSGTDWFGFFHTNGGALVKLEFGSSLTNIPVAGNITLSGAVFGTPYYSDIVFDGQNYIYFGANQSTNNISVVDLGTSLSGTNGTVHTFNVNAAGPLSISVAKECDQWYGFVGYANITDISRIEFGTSLLNPTPSIVTLTPSPAAGTTRELEIIFENNRWYLAVNTLDGNNFSILHLGTSITGNPAATTYGTFGVIAAGDYCHTLDVINSQVIGLSVNYGTGAVSRIFFPGPSAMPMISTLDNPSAAFNTTGWNRVVLTSTDENFNSSSYTDSIYIIDAPQAGFTNSPICENTVFQLTDTSLISTGTIVSWLWDFGDGNSSTQPNPQHIYTVTDTFTVTLEVTSSSGCITTAGKDLIVSPLPVAGATFQDPSCQHSFITFTDNSTLSTGSLNEWQWSFGNGDTSGQQNPSYAYSSDGNYSIELIVISDAGCRDTVINAITILPAPAVSFITESTCMGDTVQFIDQSLYTGTGSLDYLWNFGDGDTSSDVNPLHVYPDSLASWTVSLIVQSTNGCADTLDTIVTINERATPYFTIDRDTACENNPILLTDSSTAPPSGVISEWIWDFGDGDTLYGNTNITHTYSNQGTYTITLTVRTPTACDTSFSRNIHVLPGPKSGFISGDVCFGAMVSFTDTTITPPGTVLTNWTWSFGDADSSSIQNPSHNYTAPGNYPVTLIVENDKGCLGFYTDTVNVYPLPVSNFNFPLVCSGQDITFIDSSYVPNDSISQWTWDFGDSNGSTVQNPVHAYTTTGLFPVTLVSSTIHGCTDTITKYLVVNQSPAHSITASNSCFGTGIPFSTSPVIPLNDTIGYLWNFGDNTFSSDKFPTHNFFLPGNYTVTLITTNLVNGCTADTSQNITVYELPVAGFEIPSPCINSLVSVNDTSNNGSAAINTWFWDFGAAGNSNVQNPQVTFSSAGNYPVELIVEDALGCKDSVTQVVTVHSLPVVSAVPTISLGPPPLNVTFTNSSTTPGSYFWNFDDGTGPDTSYSPVHTFSDTGSYHVNLTVTSPFGCIDSAQFNILVLVPYTDLAVEAVSFTRNNNYWVMKSNLRNTGNIAISHCEISGYLDTKSPFAEEIIFNSSLAPGELYEYTYNTRFYSEGSDHPAYFCSRILEVNSKSDHNPSNDEKCGSVTNEFEIISIRSLPDFNQLLVSLNLPAEGNTSVRIWSIDGKKARDIPVISLSRGFTTLNVDVTGMAAAVYLLEVTYLDKTIVRKFYRQ